MALCVTPFSAVLRRPGVQCRAASSPRHPLLLSPRGYLKSHSLAESQRSNTFKAMRVHASPKEEASGVVYNKEFGYSRKDVILIGVGLIAFGYALYYGLQANGMEAGYAGNVPVLHLFRSGRCFYVRAASSWIRELGAAHNLYGHLHRMGLNIRVARRYKADDVREAAGAVRGEGAWLSPPPVKLRDNSTPPPRPPQDAVMRKRIEEMTEEEMTDLIK